MNIGFSLDPIGRVRKIIESWQPVNCHTEKQFENSLMIKLQKELKGIKIQSQYGSGRQKVDIVVNDKIPIEIKKDLKSSSALQRTIGQLEQYLKSWETVILVLCGEVKQDLLADLKEYGKSKEGITTLFDEGVIIVVK